MAYQVNSAFLSFKSFTLLFFFSGERGNAWIRHELSLNYTTPFQVLIEGVVGTSFLSDIGLDDIVFSPECEAYSSSELPITIITSTTTPTPCPVANQVHCAGTDICIDQDKVNTLIIIYDTFLFY